jgi:hypothetical protein
MTREPVEALGLRERDRMTAMFQTTEGIVVNKDWNAARPHLPTQLRPTGCLDIPQIDDALRLPTDGFEQTGPPRASLLSMSSEALP